MERKPLPPIPNFFKFSKFVGVNFLVFTHPKHVNFFTFHETIFFSFVFLLNVGFAALC